MFDVDHIPQRAILLRSTQCREDMADAEIDEWFRGVWNVALHEARQYPYAFGLVRSANAQAKIIRVYRIMEWHERGTLQYQYRPKSDVGKTPDKTAGYEFTGRRHPEMESEYCGLLLPWPMRDSIRYTDSRTARAATGRRANTAA